ncbi:hypothetical protein I307_00508 [Cryptococcus deuterogattii 99/473]|uniref:Unplaced genomic scaffold supercont1.4, whole genome shotgun sequence n=2 Tax=Cryptococcus deuterogattii TaxID=1859096 RepID=A0A0D0V592_9TREE|nr:hypothetical protein CNBG_2165 [Cryptococcus deuterogattii R265]KIR28269.1 hypothetical protein I309_02919 [Cryptococcus deuterogattii LA55]KIR33433.1 hypothetical protein I352_04202 [Cryptococcus deuterogattii MMRL2647]KIR41824.1 hypothetical protein I313_01984 [Cryptococcus deuterogattii Ram5]KIR73351.1 hypothetical protein I310_03017 [Cryptococcus deuterogattii CA1014]KIR91686.1 hypothetical protein I304_04510 [Cryptococcus deuterogattii CBS 10090]KIR99107.1 hypothetical protein L804_03
MSVNLSTPSRTTQSQVYSVHLRHALLPELENTRQRLSTVETDIAEYALLKDNLVGLQKEQGKEVKTMSEMGAGIWVHTTIPDISVITLDLGFDLHLEMPFADAEEYVKKKLEILKKKRDSLSQKEEFLVWQIGQFQGAMA